MLETSILSFYDTKSQQQRAHALSKNSIISDRNIIPFNAARAIENLITNRNENY